MRIRRDGINYLSYTVSALRKSSKANLINVHAVSSRISFFISIRHLTLIHQNQCYQKFYLTFKMLRFVQHLFSLNFKFVYEAAFRFPSFLHEPTHVEQPFGIAFLHRQLECVCLFHVLDNGTGHPMASVVVHPREFSVDSRKQRVSQQCKFVTLKFRCKIHVQ